MEAFNIAVGVSNIVNCVTGACTLGVYRKNESCKIITHLEKSKEQLSTALKDLAKFADVLDINEYEELAKDCQDLEVKLKTNTAAVKAANANFFVRRKKYEQLLESARTLQENTSDEVLKIRSQSAAAKSKARWRQTSAQNEDARRTTAQAAGNRDIEQDSDHQNPFLDEATAAWQDHE
ncbi:hypothetical protein C0993_002014 [Termitomyces sp. T159_Od127]|nr:hypothetical protein C0993_002014 [Termitomyces sp. T159_Od127]